ncbi:MAG TPA: EthD domain-containing protein [Blastocatellia bacterium]|nr:EthD domain-containing protein [Blastocatellia bacterium]
MIKLVYCFKKRPDLTDEQFFDYWKNVHGPIGARIPGLRKLVQSHALSVPGDARVRDFDGIAELWFENIEALLAARQSPEWQESSRDEDNFIDHSHVAYFISEEHEIIS